MAAFDSNLEIKVYNFFNKVIESFLLFIIIVSWMIVIDSFIQWRHSIQALDSDELLKKFGEYVLNTRH